MSTKEQTPSYYDKDTLLGVGYLIRDTITKKKVKGTTGLPRGARSGNKDQTCCAWPHILSRTPRNKEFEHPFRV